MLNYSAVRLSTQEWERIVRLGAEKHSQELTDELAAVRAQVAMFERKYGVSFAQLQRVGLPDDSCLEAHEDYVEWSSWEGRAAELKKKLLRLRMMAGSAYAG